MLNRNYSIQNFSATLYVHIPLNASKSLRDCQYGEYVEICKILEQGQRSLSTDNDDDDDDDDDDELFLWYS